VGRDEVGILETPPMRDVVRNDVVPTCIERFRGEQSQGIRVEV
jgi:hypothetical protein